MTKAGAPPVVEVGAGERLFSWRLEGAVAGRSALAGAARGPRAAGSVRSAGVLSGARDLQVQVLAQGVKESVVLPSREVALAFPTYVDVFTVPVGVRARQGASGVEFVDGTGGVVASFGGGHAFDSSADGVGEPATAVVASVLLGQVGRSVRVQVGVDPTWLAQPDRVFPVTVDPDFFSSAEFSGGQDAYVDEAFPTTAQGVFDSGRLKVGTRSVGGSNRPTESLVQFALPAELTSEVNNVLGAQLYGFNEYSSACDRSDMPSVQVRSNAAPWSAGSVTWNNRPGVWDPMTSSRFAFGYSSSCPAAWAGIDVREQVQQWSYGSRPNFGFRLWASSLSTIGYKRFLPAESGAGPDLYVQWEPCTTINGGPNGPRKVCGEIRDKYAALGWEGGFLGRPTTDDTVLPDGVGRNTQFENGSIYFHPELGAYAVRGSIRQRWADLGWENNLGYPFTDETALPDGGRYTHFVKFGPAGSPPVESSVYWHPEFGAWDVQGPLRARWAQLGWEWGLGYPVTGQSPIGDGVGVFNDFRRPGNPSVDSIVWTAGTGANEVRDQIRLAWGSQGYQGGWLGYPTSGQKAVAGGARSEFQGGSIVRDDRAGTTVLGAGELMAPTEFQTVTQRRTQLQASAKGLGRAGAAAYDAVKFQWRPYALAVDGGWVDVPSGDLRTAQEASVPAGWLPVGDATQTPAEGVLAVKESARYTWNATATIPADGLVQVRAVFRTTDAQQRTTGVRQITVDRAGLTAANSTAPVGPGTVALLTGAYAVSGRDAEVTAPHGGLAATRTFQSNAPGVAGPLGPGWGMSLAVDEAGADYAGLLDRGTPR